jgi:hypothetical protein
MCFDFKTSIISYSLGMFAAIFALCTKQYILGMLILFYVQMQLSEALIWKGIDSQPDNKTLNKKGTSYGKYLLATHNIGIGLGVIIDAYSRNKRLTLVDYIPLIIGVVFFLMVLIIYETTKSKNTSYPANRDKNCRNNNNRLIWPYPTRWYMASFILSIILISIYMKPLYSKLFVIGILFLLLIISFVVYPKSGAISSFWCFISAVLAPLIVIANYLILRVSQ